MPLPQVFLRARREGKELVWDDKKPVAFGLASSTSKTSFGQQTPPSASSTYDSKVDNFQNKKRKRYVTDETDLWRQAHKRHSPSQKDDLSSPVKASDYSDKRTRLEKPKWENSRLKTNGIRGADVDSLNSQYTRMDMSNSENDHGPVVGRCMELEKQYFRLTSAPNPDHVRPLHVLERTLELLKKKWKAENNYNYICDQFKSLRQDLTVQHIKDAFTIEVYEIHARIALEKV